jgi:hypothetical protein
MILADLHHPAILAPSNLKCASEPLAIESLVILLAGDLSPALPIRRRLDEPRFQMGTAQRTTVRRIVWYVGTILLSLKS